MPVELLLTGGLSTLALAPISKVSKKDLPGVLEKMRQRLSASQARRKARELWTAAYVLLGLRYDEEFARALLREVLAMKESTTYQAILAEGEAKGEAKGLAKGLAEGESRGLAKEARRVLLLLGEKEFQAPADAVTRAAVEAIGDIERLEGLIAQVRDLGGWPELLAAAARPRGNGRRKGKA